MELKAIQKIEELIEIFIFRGCLQLNGRGAMAAYSLIGSVASSTEWKLNRWLPQVLEQMVGRDLPN